MMVLCKAILDYASTLGYKRVQWKNGYSCYDVWCMAQWGKSHF